MEIPGTNWVLNSGGEVWRRWRRAFGWGLAVVGLGWGQGLWAAEAAEAAGAAGAGRVDRARLAAAIERGVTWLLQQQNSNGWWSTSEQPAVTAMVLTALNREPTGRFLQSRPSELNQAYDFLLSSVRPDGSIYRVGLANYNTALSLLALSTANDPNFLPVIRNARAYLAGTQVDFGEPGVLDTPFDGGVGYGSKYQHSDMNNTLVAIEAMRWSEAALPRDVASGQRLESDLNWEAVVHFLQNCQNRKESNPAEWVSDSKEDRGGFVYYPGHSMAGGVTNTVTGRVALRSYGSISYAGLLSFMYAKLERDDPRVTAVLEWLEGNYTLDENPGMGQQGLYYYLHLMTKALTAARVGTLRVSGEAGPDTTSGAAGGGGRAVAWRDDVARRLLDLQRPDGSWVNENPRWWETDPVLVTAYMVLTLEMLHADLAGDGNQRI
ncbi:MAG: terpene cyclase/mutase family protein [Verrucomicrobiae bacterium]|nr:terpene cyclase/mutase family protein [Verrucomicrobiae bacterium]